MSLADHPQTLLLRLRETNQLVHNREWTERFVSDLILRETKYGGLLGRDISHDGVINFINGYRFHADIRAFDAPGLSAI
jgi:hypothetical protein